MSDYSPPPGSERFAEVVHRHRIESDRERERLGDAPSELLRRVLLDRGESPNARGNALGILLGRRDPAIPDLLLALTYEPDSDLWMAVVRSGCPDDPRVVERLRGLLDDPGDRAWSEAACALARLKDEAVLPRVLAWFRDGDELHRNVAIECLLQYGSPEARDHLADAFAGGGRDESDRVVLALALLRSGDERGVPFLEGVGRRADDAWSVAAATWLYCRRPRTGLELMLNILDRGTLEARRAMVMQLRNLAHLQHAFTADGIHEARCWVEQQLMGCEP